MSATTIRMPAPPDVYRDRRKRLAAAIDRPIVLFAGWARARTYAANVHPFLPGSSYRYFGGPPMQGAAWLIEPGADGEGGCTLCRGVATFDDTVWIGEGPTDGAIAGAAGIGVGALATPEGFDKLVGGRDASVICPECPVAMGWWGRLGLKDATESERTAIIDMRLYKDAHELVAMRRAAEIGVWAHQAALAATGDGRWEAELAGAMISIYVSAGAEPSFTPIVTVHGEILHRDGYPDRMRKGQLLLVDAGAMEPDGYCSDITRTWPVNGKLNGRQRAVYETVLRAQRAAIAACVPGRRFRDVHDLAARVICEGLVDAGVLKGRADDLVARRAHTLFFVHGLGHLLGLDVHDLEDFGDLAGYAPGRTRRPAFGDKFLRLDRDLAPGMVVTIEPGIYLIPALWGNREVVAPFADCVHRSVVDEMLAAGFGGIRIEDNIHVRPVASGGPENLTAALPTDADEVCARVGRPVS